MQYTPAYIEISVQEAVDQIVPLEVYNRDVSEGVIRLQLFRDERAKEPTLSISTENGYITRQGEINHPEYGTGWLLHFAFTSVLTRGKSNDNAYIVELKHTLSGSQILIAKGLFYVNKTLSTDHD